MLRPVVSLFVLLVTAVALQAQSPSSPIRQYVVTHFNSFNGLASNIVQDIIQDRQGYIWLATIDGLQRYDGNKFLTFRNHPGNPRSVPADVITKVMEDKEGNLWVWADNKVGIFNTNDFTFREVPIQGNSPGDPVYIFMMETEDQGAVTLFSYKAGFYVYDSKRQLFVLKKKFDLPDGWPFIYYHHDPATTEYWFASTAGLILYNSNTNNVNYRGHNPDKNLLIDRLSEEHSLINIFGWKGDEFWYCTWDLQEPGAPMVVWYNIKTGKKNKCSIGRSLGLGYFEVGGALKQKNDRLWVHGKSFLAEFTGGDPPFQLIRNENEGQRLKFDRVFDMFEDREQNVWLATDNGVFLFNPDAQLFNSYNLVRTDGSGVIDGPAQTALQLDNGNVFVGAWGSGLYYYDSNLNPLPLPESLQPIREPYAIWCMHKHKRGGKVWMGLQGGGLIVYDPATGKSELFYPKLMDGRTVRQMTEDLQGNLWFGTQGGHVIKWDARESGGNVQKGFVLVKERDKGWLYKLFTDSKGYVWVASAVFGLFKYDPVTNRQLEHITVSSPPGKRLWNNSPGDILQYNDSLLLIANGAVSMLNMNTGNITYITNKDGLPSNTVVCMTRDRQGIFWLGLRHGLCRMNLEKRTFARYDRRDGLTYDNFFEAGAYRMQDNRLMFLTDHNFIVFNPDRLTGEPQPPQPVITDFRLANTSLRTDSLSKLEKINLAYDNNTIAIEFSGLRYLRQNKMLYYYRMEGIDRDWILADDRHQAVYNYLPPGNYTFRVKCENGNGVTGAVTTFDINVDPPFWKSWWFFGLIVLAIAGILYWIDRERVNRLLAMQKVRTQIAGNLHEDINTTLNNINLLSEMARIKADKDIDRTKEYIDQISDKSHNMIIAMDDMLWTIDPANDSMEKTVLRMKEMVDALVNRHGVAIQLVVDEHIKSLRPGMMVRHEFFLIFKEGLRNMVQHTGNANVLINIDLVKSKLLLKIRDSGPGAHAFMLNSAIIRELQKRAQVINAILDIQEDGKGIALTLLVTVK